jgi:predicted RNase H-like nuclease
MAVVGGVDGARGKWLLTLVALNGRHCSIMLLDTFDAVVQQVTRHDAEMVGVDMPIGLPDAGDRPSDALARARLGPRRSSLFATPPVTVIHNVDYAAANAQHRQLTGKGLSKQAFYLFDAIRQVRSSVQPSDARFHEAHPETSFATIAGQPLAPKKTAAGVGQRLAVLRDFRPDVVELLASAPVGVGTDDVIDSLVAAWSASRHLAGKADVLGHGRDTQGYGLHLIA